MRLASCRLRVNLGYNRGHARREARAAFRFRKTDHCDGTGFRNLIEIRQQLDLIMVRAQNVSFERVVVLRRGDSGIGIRSFVTRRCDLAFLKEIFQGGQAPTG
jgi:hypothetical protein